jgi:hypothetical protein
MALKLTMGQDDIFITTDGMVVQVTDIKEQASGRPVAELSIVAPRTTTVTRLMSSDSDARVKKQIEMISQWTSYPHVERGLNELLWED